MIMAERIGLDRLVTVKVNLSGTTKFGSRRIRVKAFGPLSVYRSIGVEAGYTVGHIETGFKLVAALSEDQAVALARAVMDLDWSNAMREPARHKAAVDEAAARVRAEIPA